MLILFVLFCSIISYSFADLQDHSTQALEVQTHVRSEVQELLACYNSQYIGNVMTFEDFMEGRLSRSLRIFRVWWSNKDTSLPLTIITPSDLTRLQSLAAQCRSYPGGPLAAAVYVPLIQQRQANKSADLNQPELSPAHIATLTNVTEKLDSLFQEMEMRFSGDSSSGGNSSQPAVCAIRLIMVYEFVDEVMAVLMPSNTMRNLAMLSATTPLVAMVDVDLSISQGLAGLLANLSEGSRVSTMLKAEEKWQRTAWVMPAWDTNRRLNHSITNNITDYAISLPLSQKHKLLELWKGKDLLLPFAFDVFKLGHAPTEYGTWFVSETDYEVKFKDRYEPWFIGPRLAIPLYDGRLRGWGPDKLLHVHSTANAGFSFRVLPEVWLVHRPHELAASCHIYQHSRRSSRKSVMDKKIRFGHEELQVRQLIARLNHGYYDDSVKLMKEKRYKLVLDAPSRNCRQTLSWWKDSYATMSSSTTPGK